MYRGFSMRRPLFDTIVQGWPVAREDDLVRMLEFLERIKDLTEAEQVIRNAISDRLTRLRQRDGD